MMNWKQLITPKRFGLEEYHKESHDARNEFQRDFDRLIFSSSFRRLQNKTQVFPLPGSIFVHNRLTHSLEVASVGRSLGSRIASCLQSKGVDNPYISELGYIVSAACLAHDLGNPPFGHSGEKAIGTFFSEGKGQELKDMLSNREWADCTLFEGNANAFRLLTHQFLGRRKGGFVLTYSTLASIIKYPFASTEAKGKAKFGFFQSEEESYLKIARELGIGHSPLNEHQYMRHPLVFLVEAADDICYQIMDLEDAYKLRILSKEETRDLMMNFIPQEKHARVQEIWNMVTDNNEQIAYLRSAVIGNLIDACVDAFITHENEILQGTLTTPLIKQMPPMLKEAYQTCVDVAVKKIYCSQEVLDVELAGYKIISTLLEAFIAAAFEPNQAYSKQLLNRVPVQYDVHSEDNYTRILSILDYVSGMTDIYALDLYRKITGMSLPSL